MLIDLISKLTLLDTDYILDIANTSSDRYKRFFIEKRNGKKRAIYHPSREIKGLQRVIHDELLSNLKIHKASSAYNKGNSVRQHAEQHEKSNYLLRIDFKDFFESISSSDIENFTNDVISNSVENWTKNDTDLLVKLTTFRGGLTIGSITSPLLSNAICYQLDVALYSLSHQLGIVYTRYADDLYFSTNERGILKTIPKSVKKIIEDLEYPKNLKINEQKTHHSSRKNKMIVTGLTITNDRNISIGRDKKREVRSKIYKWNLLNLEEKLKLSGYLSYIKSVEPSFINSLCNKYSAEKIREIIRYNNK